MTKNVSGKSKKSEDDLICLFDQLKTQNKTLKRLLKELKEKEEHKAFKDKIVND